MNPQKNNVSTMEHLERGVLDRVATPIFAVDKEFNVLFINTEGCKWQGLDGNKCDELLGQKCFDLFSTSLCKTPDCPIQQATDNDRISTGITQAKRGKEAVSIEFIGNSLRDNQDNIIGGVELVTDITERLAAEAKARQFQEDQIELSTPVLSLWEGVLSIPLIGTFDSLRAQDAMEKALTRMMEDKAQVLVVDITGVTNVDTMVANHLIGISPSTARTIVHLGIDLSGLNTRSTLAEGLALAIEIVGNRRKTS
jgi:rsbT co-antagonist protein RsbR